MTAKRRAEVNRRLVQWAYQEGGLWGLALADYTTELNALARLEEKLYKTAHHSWAISPPGYVTLWFHQGADFIEVHYETEAEARAEAICQYLESQ